MFQYVTSFVLIHIEAFSMKRFIYILCNLYAWFHAVCILTIVCTRTLHVWHNDDLLHRTVHASSVIGTKHWLQSLLLKENSLWDYNLVMYAYDKAILLKNVKHFMFLKSTVWNGTE